MVGIFGWSVKCEVWSLEKVEFGCPPPHNHRPLCRRPLCRATVEKRSSINPSIKFASFAIMKTVTGVSNQSENSCDNIQEARDEAEREKERKAARQKGQSSTGGI